MSEFYGWLRGNRGTTTRGGSKDSGITAELQSWHNNISISLSSDKEGDILIISYNKIGNRKIKVKIDDELLKACLK